MWQCEVLFRRKLPAAGDDMNRRMNIRWYSFKSKDRRVIGYCPAKSKAGVALFAGKKVKELVIERVRWNGEEFVKCLKKG